MGSSDRILFADALPKRKEVHRVRLPFMSMKPFNMVGRHEPGSSHWPEEQPFQSGSILAARHQHSKQKSHPGCRAAGRCRWRLDRSRSQRLSGSSASPAGGQRSLGGCGIEKRRPQARMIARTQVEGLAAPPVARQTGQCEGRPMSAYRGFFAPAPRAHGAGAGIFCGPGGTKTRV